MNFRNPWIDPRVEALRPDDVAVYLTRTGWAKLGSALNPRLDRYHRTGDAARTVLVPNVIDDGPSLQRLIDLIGEIASVEGRYAGEIISDILHSPTEGDGERRESVTTNGAGAAKESAVPLGDRK